MDFKTYFKERNLKKTPLVGVHFEQKTTPDLLWCVAQVIIDITKINPTKIFSDKDIHASPLFDSLMNDYFSKAPKEKAKNEYNKLSSYQLGVLAFAGVIEQIAKNPKQYKVIDLPVLEFMAINDLNASKFLVEYTQKLLQDNDLLNTFNIYKEKPTKESYLKVKEAYWEWAKINTDIRTNNPTHTNRVFNKIFNVFCYAQRIPGEDGARVTSGPCPYSFLIYNRDNFRDKNMPSGMTREEYKDYRFSLLSEVDKAGIVGVNLQKVKEDLKRKYNYDSEIQESRWGYATNRVVEAHHILPSQFYPQFSLSKENLIVLTPDQHRSFAHKGNYGALADPEFQIVCLKIKLAHIKDSIQKNDNYYNLKIFIAMLNACFGLELAEESSVETVEQELLKK